MGYVSGTGDEHSCKVSIWGLETCRVAKSQESCQIMGIFSFDPSICLLEYPETILPWSRTHSFFLQMLENSERRSNQASHTRPCSRLTRDEKPGLESDFHLSPNAIHSACR